MAYVKSVILIIILLFLTTFGIKNNQPLQLYYYFDTVSVPTPVYGIVYISIVIGVIIGMVMGISSRVTLRRRVKTLQKEVKGFKENVE